MSAKGKTPIGGVPVSTSDEHEAVPANLDEFEASAAISALPVPIKPEDVPIAIREIHLAIRDINRRLREGNRKHRSFRNKNAKQDERIAALENLLVPRLTPRLIGKIVAACCAAIIVVGGWLLTFDRMASRADLEGIKATITGIEKSIDRLASSKGVTP